MTVVTYSKRMEIDTEVPLACCANRERFAWKRLNSLEHLFDHQRDSVYALSSPTNHICLTESQQMIGGLPKPNLRTVSKVLVLRCWTDETRCSSLGRCF